MDHTSRSRLMAGTGKRARCGAWCAANGDNPLLRIALCGYVEEAHGNDLPGWECIEWKAGGGYNNLGDGANLKRERIWFSPACINTLNPCADLFDLAGAT